MNTPPAVPVSAELYSFDEGDRTTSAFQKIVDDLPMLNCSLETGNPVTDLSARKVITLSRHEKIVDSLIQSQLTGLTVDDTSCLAMAEALEFSGIDTLEQAKSSNLRIIPPGPVLHTWYAKYKTGIFDGENNPSHVKGLNYVARISEQADRLKEWAIPVIIVYLEQDMPLLELKKMQTIFSNHENILVMSLEHDLTSIRTTAHYKSLDAVQLLDEPRFLLCREFPEILSLAQKKAESVSKTLLLHNLLALGGLSIIYSDIDNTFLRRPIFQLAANGARNVCTFNVDFLLQDDSKYEKYLDSPSIYETAKKHGGILSHEGSVCEKKKRFSVDTLKDRSATLYKYLFSGEAIENYRILKPDLGTDMNIFQHESAGYIVMSQYALTVVDQDYTPLPLTVEDQYYTPLPLTVVDQDYTHLPGLKWYDAFLKKQKLNHQLLKLHGLQQLKQIHIGRDMTWTSGDLQKECNVS